jgi:hypothetical protein
MKTTIDLPDELLLRGKRVALERRVTLKYLIERGLQREIQSPSPEEVGAISMLKSLDSSIWGSVSADQYVQQQRADWE